MPRVHADAAAQGKDPFLVTLGARVRALRERQDLTRRAAARAAGVSERHLANLEYGVGNASILVLSQLARALRCPLAELYGDITTSSPEWRRIRALLAGCDEQTLREARVAVGELLGAEAVGDARALRIALIGLRGAGKSTLGPALAHDLGVPFVELSREIERLAGCSIAQIQSLYGPVAYRRYERRALEEAIELHAAAVIAAPGGLVADPATFNLLLAHCTTVWLEADPADHLARVIAQGDLRPLAASGEAIGDLEGILEGRRPFYSKADLRLDTSAGTLEEVSLALRRLVRDASSPIVAELSGRDAS